MKKRLKGLVGLWLVVAMVCGMTLVPAMAASADSGTNPDLTAQVPAGRMIWWENIESGDALGTGIYVGGMPLNKLGYYYYEETAVSPQDDQDYSYMVGGLYFVDDSKPADEEYNICLAYTDENKPEAGLTLTIKGLKVTAENYNYYNTYGAITSECAPLTLELEGENVLVGPEGYISAGVFSRYGLAVTGSGSLAACGGLTFSPRSLRSDHDIENGSFGILAFGDLFIEGNVNAVGGYAEEQSGGEPAVPFCAGIGAFGDIYILHDAVVTAEGCDAYKESYGIVAFEAQEEARNASGGNIFIEGGSVTATAGMILDGISCGIGADGMVEITNGSVTANGGAMWLYSNENVYSFGIGALDGIAVTGGTVTANGGSVKIDDIGEQAAYGLHPESHQSSAEDEILWSSFGFGTAGNIVIGGDAVVNAAGGNWTLLSIAMGAEGDILIGDRAKVTAKGGSMANIPDGSSDIPDSLVMISFGVGANGQVTVSGTATLNAVGGDAGYYSMGVGSDLGILIKDSAVILVTGGKVFSPDGMNGKEWNSPRSFGLATKAGVMIGGGVTITALSNDVFEEDQNTKIWARAIVARDGIGIASGNYLLYANKALTSLDKLDWPATWYFQMVPAPVYDNYVPEYRIEVKDGIEDGTVTTRVKYAAEGDRVGITVTPEEGFELDQLIVTTPKGKEIETTYINGKYIFEMPASKVLIDAVFVADVALPFLDVTVDDWYFDAVKYVYDNDIMAGTGATAFAPDTELSRAMVAQVLYNLDEERYIADDALFADVVPGEWYVNAVNWAAAEKIFAGYGNGNFGTLDSVTREQLAVILYNYAVSKDGAVSGSSVLGMYPDAGEISFWAVEAMEWAVANDILRAESGLLTAAANASRADVAYAMMNFCENIMQK